MLLSHRFVGVLLVPMLAGCSTIEVSVDYDSSVDFSRFTTFDWLPGSQKATGDPRIDNPLLESRIRNAVESQLAAKAYRKVAAGSPDFFIGYHVAIERRLSVENMNSTYGYAPGWGWDDNRYGHGWGYRRPWGPAPMPRTCTRYYDEGSLILDFVTPHAKGLIWRGAAKAEIHEADRLETKRKRIKDAVRRMLERFPPE